MDKCALCKSNFYDGVKCLASGNQLDFGCASISESGWRSLVIERRAVWKCSSCRALSPAPAPDAFKEQVSSESLMKEIRDISFKLTNPSTLIKDVKSIKDGILFLTASCDFSSVRLDELDSKLVIVESSASKYQQNQGLLESTLGEIQAQVYNSEQRSRLNNIDIKGVSQGKDKNLFTIVEKISAKVGNSLPKTQINYIAPTIPS